MQHILIANRGEIAVRVIRTWRAMGIRTVAVYADPDREAPFVRAADEAVSIGPPVATSSFLAIEAMLDVARRTGADATIMKGLGHFPMSEEPARFVEYLLPVLKRIRGA